MTEKCRELFEEIKDYTFVNNETFEREVFEDAPEEIKEKFKLWQTMEDDEIIVDSKEDL